MAGTWATTAARRIGEHAGLLAAVTGEQRANPFTGRIGMEDLAAAWQYAYDRAVHPSSGGGS